MHRIAIGLCILLLAGCESSLSPGVPDRVVDIQEDDAAMNAAIARAKETFPQFENHWQGASVQGFSIKFAMDTDHQGVEHIWFTPLKIEGERITASCANEPQGIAALKLGEVRELERSRISDWMILDGEKCYGGYTIRVLAEQDPSLAPQLDFADYGAP